MRALFLAGIISFCTVCSGCQASEQSQREEAHRLAVEWLTDWIQGIKRMSADDFPEEVVRHRTEFLLPAYQAALAFLMAEGPSALKEPLVVWAAIFPDPRKDDDPRKQDRPYTHGIQIEWMEVGSQVTGFYLVMKDGATQEFKLVSDTNDEHLGSPPPRPERHGLALFTHDKELSEAMRSDGFITWPPGLYEQVITRREVKSVGLILQDGSKTEPGPVSYRYFPPAEDVSKSPQK